METLLYSFCFISLLLNIYLAFEITTEKALTQYYRLNDIKRRLDYEMVKSELQIYKHINHTNHFKIDI